MRSQFIEHLQVVTASTWRVFHWMSAEGVRAIVSGLAGTDCRYARHAQLVWWVLRLKPFFAICLSVQASAAPDTLFQAVGKVTCEKINTDSGQVFVDREVNFSVSVDGCRWLIRTWAPSTFQTNGISYREVGCDGTNIYAVTAFDGDYNPMSVAGKAAYSNGMTGNPPATFQKSRNDGTAVVTPGLCPDPTKVDQLTIPVWLAYVSSCYLAQSTNSHLRPPYSMGPFVDTGDFSVAAQWEWFPESRFPSRVIYFDDGNVHGPSGPTALRPPYDQGYTSAVYEVLSTAQIDSSSLPSEFRLTRFGPAKGGKRNTDLRTVATFTGKAENFWVSRVPDSYVPSLPTNSYVRDQRFPWPGQSGFLYVSSNGVWSSAADVEVQLAASQGTSALPRRSSRILIGCLLLVPTSFLALIVLRGLKRSPEKENTQDQ